LIRHTGIRVPKPGGVTPGQAEGQAAGSASSNFKAIKKRRGKTGKETCLEANSLEEDVACNARGSGKPNGQRHLSKINRYWTEEGATMRGNFEKHN